MTTDAASASRLAPASSRTRTVLLAGAGVVVAVAANLVVASAALAAGADPRFSPLTWPLVTGFTAAGVIAALVGWRVVVGRVRASRRLLAWLVPALLVLSFVPDLLVPFTGIPPYSTAIGIVALLLMHTVAVAVAVPVAQHIAPAR